MIIGLLFTGITGAGCIRCTQQNEIYIYIYIYIYIINEHTVGSTHTI